MKPPFPSPTEPRSSRAEVFLGYLDFFRATLLDKLEGLGAGDLTGSRLPSGWTPLQLLKHLTYVERRWLVWGFEGAELDDPWGDAVDGVWRTNPGEGWPELRAGLLDQADRTRQVVESHDLADLGRPGPRWEGAEPATLERVLFHLLQEYARHTGQLDIVCELAGGQVGE